MKNQGGDRRYWKRPRQWLRFSLFILIPAAAAGLVYLAIRLFFSPAGQAEKKPVPPEPAVVVAAPPPPPPITEEKIIIPHGASLARLLKTQGFDGAGIQKLRESVKPVYDLAKIKAGHEMRLAHPPAGVWQSLEYDIDESQYLVVQNTTGGIKAEIRAYPFEIRPALAYGLIETSLIAAITKHGEESTLAMDLVERCFGWDIDFYTDLRKGDTFKILVEKKYLNGKFSGYRNILAAEFVNGGRLFQAFRFTYPDSGITDYFDETGLSKRKEFLKSPFKFTPRITSRFTSSRLDPIYKVYRPHYGVDYGAPIGTPVQATADGRVMLAGWNDGAGREVRLQHKNHYETLYMHLSGFAAGIEPGADVRSGQVIAYVGSTGDSTGPHLDYRIYFHGTPVNPLAEKFKPADPVRKEHREAYKQDVQKLLRILDAPRIVRTALLAFSF